MAKDAPMAIPSVKLCNASAVRLRSMAGEEKMRDGENLG